MTNLIDNRNMPLGSNGSLNNSRHTDLNLRAIAEEIRNHSENSNKRESEEKRPCMLELLKQYGTEFYHLKVKKKNTE